MLGMKTMAATARVVAVLALGPGTAFAQAPVSYQKYDSLSDQIAVLKQQVKIAKLKAQIANAGKSPSNGGVSSLPGALPPGLGLVRGPGNPKAAGQPPRRSEPEIVSIDGRGNHLIAELLMPSGGEVIASHGNTLSDGLVVRSVTPDGVSVVKDGKVVSLPFEGSAAPAATTAHKRGDSGPSGAGVEQVR